MAEPITRLSLSRAEQQAFAQALITPPAPNAALERAFAKSKNLLAAELPYPGESGHQALATKLPRYPTLPPKNPVDLGAGADGT